MQPTEHTEQKLFFQWCLRHSEEYRGIHLIFAIPNGGKRDAISGKRLKDEGVRAGIPDMFLPVPLFGFHGLFIEMKTRTKGVVSPNQKEWLRSLDDMGYCCRVAKGFQQAREYVLEYYQS